MSKVYIVSAKRTAVGGFMGSLSKVKPAELGGAVIKNIIEETKIDPKNIDEVVLGNVLSAGHGQGVGRQAALAGGVPVEVPAYTVNIICGSGMKTLMLAYNAIKSGEANMIMAGGVESMSMAPYLIPGSTRSGHRMGDFKTIDHMVFDALTDAFGGYHMGVTAENIAEKYSLSKESQDAFAIESQRRAIAAVDSGRFEDEIVPIEVRSRRETIVFDTDEHPNRKTSLEKLGKLKTIFKRDGTVTAGNASGINDGASVMLVVSEEAVKKYELTPLVEIVSTGQGGVDPSIMGMGPVPAIKNALGKAGMTLKEMELLELNEAFAAQSLGVMTELTKQYDVTLDWFTDKTNVNGGAIALGHPVGASGNRITTTLIHEMKKSGVNFGLASLCIGGGMGTAVILKNIK